MAPSSPLLLPCFFNVEKNKKIRGNTIINQFFGGAKKIAPATRNKKKSALILDRKNAGIFFYPTHMNTQRGEGSVVRSGERFPVIPKKGEILAIKIQGNRKE